MLENKMCDMTSKACQFVNASSAIVDYMINSGDDIPTLYTLDSQIVSVLHLLRTQREYAECARRLYGIAGVAELLHTHKKTEEHADVYLAGLVALLLGAAAQTLDKIDLE